MMDTVVDDLPHDTDNQVNLQGWQLASLLLGSFRTLVDEAHRLLAARGHPDVRPAHGFTLQAIADGATASELAARLGVSKQAAAKTVAHLERQGYVARTTDPADARRRTVRATGRGRDLLEASASAFEEVVAAWRLRADVDAAAAELLRLGVAPTLRVDLGAWVG